VLKNYFSVLVLILTYDTIPWIKSAPVCNQFVQSVHPPGKHLVDNRRRVVFVFACCAGPELEPVKTRNWNHCEVWVVPHPWSIHITTSLQSDFEMFNFIHSKDMKGVWEKNTCLTIRRFDILCHYTLQRQLKEFLYRHPNSGIRVRTSIIHYLITFLSDLLIKWRDTRVKAGKYWLQISCATGGTLRPCINPIPVSKYRYR